MSCYFSLVVGFARVQGLFGIFVCSPSFDAFRDPGFEIATPLLPSFAVACVVGVVYGRCDVKLFAHTPFPSTLNIVHPLTFVCSVTAAFESNQDPSKMQEVVSGETIIYTYDVSWMESDTHWASRWDIYLTMNHAVKNRVRLLGYIAYGRHTWRRSPLLVTVKELPAVALRMPCVRVCQVPLVFLSPLFPCSRTP